MLPAVLLALGIHALLFNIPASWIKKTASPRPKLKTVTISMVSLKPEVHRVETALSVSPVPPLPPALMMPKKTRKIPKTTIVPIPRLKQLRRTIDPLNAVAPLSNGKKSLKTDAPSFPETKQKKAGKQPIPKPKEPQATKEIPVSDGSLSISRMLPKNEIAATPGKIPPGTLSERKAVPLYKKKPLPIYPRIARRRGYQGTVILEVRVDKNGKVSDIHIAESSGYAVLDQRAVDTVKNWLFEPGTKGGRTVDSWVKIPIRFQLK